MTGETKFEICPLTEWTVTVPGLKKNAPGRKHTFYSDEEMHATLPKIAKSFYLETEDLLVQRWDVFGVYAVNGEYSELLSTGGLFGSREDAESNLRGQAHHWKELMKYAEMK